jgi:RNA polymerase sigma-70 factor (ECF subfamily)
MKNDQLAGDIPAVFGGLILEAGDMGQNEPNTERLIALAVTGDSAARQGLLALHRDRLRRMVAVHLDRRLLARLDPSDVVQEALMDAAQKLSDYLRRRPLPFYPWLRRLAWERLVKLHRQHLSSRKRSATREQQNAPFLPDESAAELADHLAGSGTSPSQGLLRAELRLRVKNALAQLPASDRELLVMRYLEQLSSRQIGDLLEIGEGAVRMRHRRALERLSRLLRDQEGATEL